MLQEVIIEQEYVNEGGAYSEKNSYVRVIKITRDGHVFRQRKNGSWKEVTFALGKFSHILVCETFNGPKPSPELMCCHKDDDRSNNAASNLYWGSDSDNKKDAIRNGRNIGGDRRSQLNEEDKQLVLKMKQAGFTRKETALKLGVTEGIVAYVLRKYYASIR